MSAEPAKRAVQIDCVRRDERGRVTHLGGPRADGTRWLLEIGEVIALARDGDARYFMSRDAQHVGLKVERGELVTMTGDGWSVAGLPNCRD